MTTLGTEQLDSGEVKEIEVHKFRNVDSLTKWCDNPSKIKWLKKKYSPEKYTAIADKDQLVIIVRLRE